jgi:AraC-like DNA-binding protein
MWTNAVKRWFNPSVNGPVFASHSVADVLTGHRRQLTVVWWCLCLCIICSSLIRFDVVSSGFLFYVLVYAGSAGCAWFWLLSRCLFRKQTGLTPWGFVVVALVMLTEGTADWFIHTTTPGTGSETVRVMANAASVICIAAIVFVFHETLQGIGTIKNTSERRFRYGFIAGFGLMTGVAVLWVMGAYSDSFAARWNAELLTLCAVMGVAGSRLAVQYRLRHPLINANQYHTDAAGEAQLAERIQQAISDEALLTQADLKVADFARHLGEQEYKVTRCISNRLNYRNFNHLLNSARIRRARVLLKDPANEHKTIASIAFDCGYNSLGPFNRAFKQITKLTPREFRNKAGH